MHTHVCLSKHAQTRTHAHTHTHTRTHTHTHTHERVHAHTHTYLSPVGGAAKVAQHPAACRVLQHIFGLKVPVGERGALAVHVQHCLAHLREHLCKAQRPGVLSVADHNPPEHVNFKSGAGSHTFLPCGTCMGCQARPLCKQGTCCIIMVSSHLNSTSSYKSIKCASHLKSIALKMQTWQTLEFVP